MNPNEQEAAVLEAAAAAVEKDRLAGEEKHKKVIDQAAKIVAIMETEGYKAIIEFIEDCKKSFSTRADQLLHQNPTTMQLDVNPILVAHIGSTYMAYEAIIDGFARMKKLVESEAEKNRAESK